MQRRKYLAAIGSLAAGGAAAMGTGAFTSAEANRQVSVNVADDANAYLGLESADGDNGAYVNEGNNQVTIDFGNSGNGGTGVGGNSVYDFEDVLKVMNQGTQPVDVYVDDSDLTGITADIDDSGTGAGTAVNVTTGNSVSVDFKIDSKTSSPSGGTLTIHAIQPS